MTIQYSTKIDPVVYGASTEEFESAEWIALALAALDQAGVAGPTYDRIAQIIDDGGYAIVGDGQVAPTE